MSDTQTDQKELELLKIEESADGSAIIELPPDMENPQAPEKPAEIAASDDSDGSDEDDEAAREREMAQGGQVDPNQEAIRAAKREKRRARKEYHRKVEAEKNVELQLLRQQNQALTERLSVVERRTQGSELAQLNAAIEDAKTRIAFAKTKMKEAVDTGNGELLAQAQEMWFDSRKAYENLEQVKKKVVAPQQNSQIQGPDPIVQKHATKWMNENPWYDPTGSDQDSSVAMSIDKRMISEGWDPRQNDYWSEFNRRLRNYLPHRYTDDADDEPVQSVRKPRAVVTGSGRENAMSSGGKGNTFTLSPEQVRAMKDAGMWDDQHKRAKMIKRYAEMARQQRS